jgi:hypothetical protein
LLSIGETVIRATQLVNRRPVDGAGGGRGGFGG